VSQAQAKFNVGVMKTPVERTHDARFNHIVDTAVNSIKDTLTEDLDLSVQVFNFTGPHLTPVGGAYVPLDFLHLGLAEKLERDIHFLLIVTEVDLSASRLSYVLALPSQLTNVGILSTKRLAPSFWGEPENERRAIDRLASLMLHTFAHLLNLNHDVEPSNVMHNFDSVEDLDRMDRFTPDQLAKMSRIMPREAHERTSKGNLWWFAIRRIAANWRSILDAIVEANPFYLLTRLPTMATTALSVIIVLFFSSEIWDVASTVELYQLALFSVVAVLVAAMVLHRAFAFRAIRSRGKRIAESTVVTEAAMILNVLLTMLLFYLGFFVLSYLGVLTIFPQRLMTTWPTVDPAVRVLDHIKLSMFLASIGLIAGSLGGRADTAELIRHILFLEEET
jgi:hypothetical protein